MAESRPFDDVQAGLLATAAASAAEDVSDYSGMWDARRVGRMLARDPVFAELVPIALGEIERLRLELGEAREARLAVEAVRDRAVDEFGAQIADLWREQRTLRRHRDAAEDDAARCSALAEVRLAALDRMAARGGELERELDVLVEQLLETSTRADEIGAATCPIKNHRESDMGSSTHRQPPAAYRARTREIAAIIYADHRQGAPISSAIHDEPYPLSGIASEDMARLAGEISMLIVDADEDQQIMQRGIEHLLDTLRGIEQSLRALAGAGWWSRLWTVPAALDELAARALRAIGGTGLSNWRERLLRAVRREDPRL